MNYLLDVNIILDYYNQERREKYPESIRLFEYALKEDNFFVSSASLDNIAYLLANYMRKDYGYTLKQRKFLASKVVEFLIKNFKIAKTPAYLEIDYEDIEDSQIIASAKAIDALVLTRDEKMLSKYPDMTITPSQFLKQYTNPPITNNQSTNKLTIDFANLKKQYFLYQDELEEEMDKVLNSAAYIMGSAVKELEENLCKFTGTKNAISCSSGTDALLLAMMAIGIKPGDEVITTPFTFIATAETIALLGAKPVFVDIDETTYNIDVSKIESAITPKTKAIMPVSLYGQPCDLEAIRKLLDKQELERQKLEVGSEKLEEESEKTSNFKLQTSSFNKIYLIVDGAQSFGATYKGKAEVHYADIYTTSFFPAKPLGCFGDGGAVLTNSDELAEKIRMLRVHGQNRRYHHKYIGLGARMDTLQCAVVNVKLKHYKEDLAKRQEVAFKYNEELRIKSEELILPYVDTQVTSAWAQYSIRLKGEGRREKVQEKLKEAGIPTAVHYPMPLHLQECFAYLGYKEGDFPIAEKVSKEIMSLPMNPYLSDEEIGYVAEKLLL